MKKLLKFELFNYCNQDFEKLLNFPSRCWVAELVNLSNQYGFQRRFLKPKIDYAKSNSKMSRGVFGFYHLEVGKLYEVKHQTSWKNTERYFLLCGTGKINKNQAIEWLKNN